MRPHYALKLNGQCLYWRFGGSLLVTCATTIIDPAEEASREQTVGSSTPTRQGFQSGGSRSLPLR
jgi:hypothetical protein